MQFIDEAKIYTKSGNGGPGSVSFRKESHVPRGGPDGGDGGRGAHVFIRAIERSNTLLNYKFKKKFVAQHGEQGSKRNRSGTDGEDLYLDVPVGTVVKDENGKVVVDLDEIMEFQLLTGGMGGKGNTFYKSSINQAPGYCQGGIMGQEAEFTFELKLIAHIGIIGFPNVGKSTLISKISAAKPKIANYEFTTLIPNLGVVGKGSEKSFVVADIPGLIPGASKGEGLGHKFLKHTTRTKSLLHVVDVTEFTCRDPFEDYLTINEELKLYDEQFDANLTQKPQVVVLNKCDSVQEDRLSEIITKFKANGIETLQISAVTGYNLSSLTKSLELEVYPEEVY